MSKINEPMKKHAEIAVEIEAEKTKGGRETLSTVRGLFKQYKITMLEVKPWVVEQKLHVGKDGAAVAKKRAVRKSVTGAKCGHPTRGKRI